MFQYYLAGIAVGLALVIVGEEVSKKYKEA
jgi:hypothetical protein